METRESRGTLFSTILASLTTAMLLIAVSVCAASFIFSGMLSIYLPAGITIALISSLVIGGTLAFRGSFPATIGAAAIIPSIVIGVIAQSIYKDIISSGPVEQVIDSVLPTILAFIMIGTLLTGVVFYLIGHFKWGSLVRFIPYPVMGGFLAGVGWLITIGSINVMRRVPISIENQFDYLFNTPTLMHLAPGIALGIALLWISKKTKHYLALPITLVGAVGIFYAGCLFTGTTISAAVEMGWLIEPFSFDHVRTSYDFRTLFSNMDVSILPFYIGDLVVILCLSLVAVLLTATGIEAAVNRELNLDHDLRFSGIGNMISGLFGGVIGYHFVWLTRTNFEAGSRTRLPGLLAVAILGLSYFSPTALVCWIPKPVLGGILLFFGFGLLYEWLYQSWFRFSRMDYGLLLMIFVSIITLGFLPGIVIGIGLSMILFVIKYSQVSIIKHSLTGLERKSNVERNFLQLKALNENGHKISLISLQGFIFFGSAHNLFLKVKNRLEESPQMPKFVLFDFRLVNGLDSSAGHSFNRIKTLLYEYDCSMIMTHLASGIQHQLEMTGCIDLGDPKCHVFEDTDYGLEWCEDHILRELDPSYFQPRPITQIVTEWFGKEATANEFLGYMEEHKVSSGTYLFKQGDLSDAIYILEFGEASVFLELPTQKKRLKKVKEGALIGEMGVYRNVERSASLITDGACTFFRLSQDHLKKMEEEKPDVAAVFHEFVSKMLSNRLEYTNNMVTQLL